MPTVKLSIARIEGYPGNYQVNISGSGFQPNKQVNWRLRGDDPVSDDNIIYPRGGGAVNSDGTIAFQADAISGNLNEDWGNDEIYAEVYYADIGSTRYKSNVVSGDY